MTAQQPNNRVYFSERGFPLSYSGRPPSTPVVCVEVYMKWYDLYLVRPDGSVEKLPDAHEGIEDAGVADHYAAGAALGDHRWNPVYVESWADAMEYALCDQARELLVARWLCEHLEGDRGESLQAWCRYVWGSAAPKPLRRSGAPGAAR